MTKEQKYKLAKWALSYALENGAQQSSVSISNSQSSGIEIREEKIDKLEQATRSGLSIRLFVDGRYSSHSTNLMKKEELKHFISEAIKATRHLSEDDFRTLPDPSLYYKGGGGSLQTIDPDFASIDPQQKINMAYAAEKEVLGKDDRIISVSANYSDRINERIMVTSNGFEGDSSSSYYTLSASVSVKDEDARPESYWYESAIRFDDLIKEGVGTKALKRSLDKIGQSKIESERLPMIVENRLAGRIFGPLISALNGSAIQQKKSFLIDKLDQKVASGKLTITDDPFIPGGRGSRHFDGEGLATKKRKIFENGVLRTYLIDTYYAKKLETVPTGGSLTNLVFKSGDKNLEEIIASVEKGILVTGFNGGNSNGTTGDFSYGIEGFLVENGKLTQPVSEMNITGNMKDLWSNIGEIGNDANQLSSWRIPSILFNEVDFSGS